MCHQIETRGIIHLFVDVKIISRKIFFGTLLLSLLFVGDHSRGIFKYFKCFREIHHFKVKFQTITKSFCIATMQQCYIFYFLSNICMTKNHLTMNRYMLCLWHEVIQPKITTRKGTNIYEKYVSQQLYNYRTTSVPKLVYCS